MKKLLFIVYMFMGMCIPVFTADSIKASSFGFNSSDATACLQKAIDSGRKHIIIDNVGEEWLLTPIQLRSNIELIVTDGVVLRAKPGAFKSQAECLFTGKDIDNVIIRGEGKAVIGMNKLDYQDKERYRTSEWRHAISLCGATNVTIRDLNIESSGGDGIYIGGGTKYRGCKNINLLNLNVSNHHRQGISIISAENLLIKNCNFSKTGGTPPNCGLDYEPNKADEFLINCVVEDCDFTGNSAYGILIALACFNSTTKPISLEFKNCRIRGNFGGIRIYCSAASEHPIKGIIKFTDNVIINDKNAAIKLDNISENGFNLIFKNTRLDNRGNAQSPINITSKLGSDCGNIDFGDMIIVDNARALPFDLGLGVAGLTGITGNISIKTGYASQKRFNLESMVKVNAPNPELKKFQVKPVDLKKIIPSAGTRGIKTTSLRIRGNSRFLQYVAPGATVNLQFTPQQVRPNAPKIPVIVKDNNETEVDRFIVEAPGRSYRLSSDVGGMYSFEINAGGDTVSVFSNAPGHGFTADSKLWLFRCNSLFYFIVPAAANKVKVEVNGEEKVSANLIDGSGNIKAAAKAILGSKILLVNRIPTRKDEIWKLELYSVEEDYSFRLGTPLLPIVSTSPENLLVEIK